MITVIFHINCRACFITTGGRKTISRRCATRFSSSAKPKKFLLMRCFPNFGPISKATSAIFCLCSAALPKAKKYPSWQLPPIKTSKKSLPNAAILCNGPIFRNISAIFSTASAKMPMTRTYWKNPWNISTMRFIYMKICSLMKTPKSSLSAFPKPANI